VIYKVGILGASGRMGQEIAALLSNGFALGSDSFELCDGITQSGRLQSIDGMPLRLISDPPREPVHVWIDFSRPEATLDLLQSISTPVVIGTTGFKEPELEAIRAFAKTYPVLLCPNTSPGMSVMLRIVRETAPLGRLGFATVLHEEHHKHKQDSPSGTAKRLLSALEEAGFDSTQVHVTRAGSTVGTHTVRWVAEGEEILVEHRVTDRRVFAKGALLGASFLAKQTVPRVYRFEEIQW
jgi:4-hydroxy-tetrahydrodipicolinate reductase